MKKTICIFLLLAAFSSFAQHPSKQFRTKAFKVVSDTLRIDSVSISPYNFRVFDGDRQKIDSTEYTIDFARSLLILDRSKYASVIVEYQALPEFLTRDYAVFDQQLIVPRVTDLSRLYKAQNTTRQTVFRPFEGLQTSGSISRGLTTGNNQDAVVNSNLDLQISGNLSRDVRVRASITDSNIPLQENGYTQRLDEFDRVYIELFSKNWSVKAGDINLTNTADRYLRFNKKVAGMSLDASIAGEESETDLLASGALVRGQFTSNTFTGQDGNQGPYKITGSGSQQYLLIISGSETVYVNGIPLKRGENNDYTIDYNTAELTFMPTFPVTSNMRFTVEYQVADRNFTRFVTYDGAAYKTDKFDIGFHFYNENDLKNQTLQQDLSDNQKEILSQAGDDLSLMVVPSATPDVYKENKILYKKEMIDGVEVFVFSNEATDALYNVKFTYVGANAGNYRIQTTIASGRIYEYVAPQSGIPQGDYAPVVQLIAPNKLQLVVFNSHYRPNEKTKISSELAYSNKDKNLFSRINDADNTGFAGNINWEQQLTDGKWKLASNLNYEFVHKNFNTVERLNSVEFQRDWDLMNPSGNQNYLNTTLLLRNESKGQLSYKFSKLDYSDSFNGNRHSLMVDLILDSTSIKSNGSYLKADASSYKATFLRAYTDIIHRFNKKWIGARLQAERNEHTDKTTNTLSVLSHRYLDYEGYFGLGDTLAVYAEVGYNHSVTDSLRTYALQTVNKANMYFLKSRLLSKKTADITLFVNYRHVKRPLYNDEALNARLSYRQQLFDNGISLQTIYETNAGTLPQQEFSYVEVETGLGYYTWIDYNGDGIQQLDEFEVAKFQDEANYVRIMLPTINFIKTNQNKFSQALTLNPSKWGNREGFRKLLSHFINQSFILFDGKHRRGAQGLNFNPFSNTDDLLAFNFNLKNSFYFNRGRQHYSTTYTFIQTANKNTFSITGLQQSMRSHQLQFNHKIGKFWLFDLIAKTSENKSESEAFNNRNFTILSGELNPKIAYVLNPNTRFEAFYHLKHKENKLDNFEKLIANTLGMNGFYASGKSFSLQTSFNLILNAFEGNENSSVAYQMLEGLRSGTNFTWNLNLQKRINSYLDLNISYFGRKSEQTNAIHTGSIQLRATF